MLSERFEQHIIDTVTRVTYLIIEFQNQVTVVYPVNFTLERITNATALSKSIIRQRYNGRLFAGIISIFKSIKPIGQ
jgi:hypothetical protein